MQINIDSPQIELIITSKNNLTKKYGEDGFVQIETKLKALQMVLRLEKLNSALVYIDDKDSLRPFEQKPLNAVNPDEIKNLIDKIHEKIKAQKKELKHILILGGDTIIPFHRIKNPTNDQDDYVLTDNPYASTDADIYIPERSLGRIPDSKSANISFLASQLDTAITYHKNKNNASKYLGYWSFQWDKAAAAVYSTISNAENYHTCLPTTETNFVSEWINGKLYQYFNFHGSEDTANWYSEGEFPYPIAFSAENLDKANIKGAIVYCEACYGANIIDKDIDETLSLKFLNGKAVCFVGSTKIAYGASEPPLGEADLLGIKFFDNIKNKGMAFGEAFMKAKQLFAKELINKQKFLDGDQKKTLIEFVLYGDPSLKIR